MVWYSFIPKRISRDEGAHKQFGSFPLFPTPKHLRLTLLHNCQTKPLVHQQRPLSFVDPTCTEPKTTQPTKEHHHILSFVFPFYIFGLSLSLSLSLSPVASGEQIPRTAGFRPQALSSPELATSGTETFSLRRKVKSPDVEDNVNHWK